MTTAPSFWTTSPCGSQGARNVAACALVAARVFESQQWVYWHGGRGADHNDPANYHVPGAEEIAAILHDLRTKALAAKDTENAGVIRAGVGHTRFIAWADDDGPDSFVDFYMSIGDSWPSAEGDA